MPIKKENNRKREIWKRGRYSDRNIIRDKDLGKEQVNMRYIETDRRTIIIRHKNLAKTID